MKKILWAVSITMLVAGVAQADLVYSTDFSTGYVSGGSGAHVFGGATPNVSTNEWFGSTNGAGISGGDLTLNNSTQNRYRGSGVWLDASAWVAGLVTVEVDVANYVAGADTELIFQAYAATGVDTENSVSLDLHGAVSTGAVLANTGTAAISSLGAEQTITANGTDIPFTFTYNGTDDFIGLVFAIKNAAGGTAFGSADIDNLAVNAAVPEPAVLSFIAIFGGGLLFARRFFEK